MESCWKKNSKLRDDMYSVNNKLSELLLEDSNVSSYKMIYNSYPED